MKNACRTTFALATWTIDSYLWLYTDITLLFSLSNKLCNVVNLERDTRFPLLVASLLSDMSIIFFDVISLIWFKFCKRTFKYKLIKTVFALLCVASPVGILALYYIESNMASNTFAKTCTLTSIIESWGTSRVRCFHISTVHCPDRLMR